MSDVSSGSLIPVAVQPHDGVVAGAGLHHTHIAAGAAVIHQPFAKALIGEAAAHRAGVQGGVGIRLIVLLVVLRHIVGGQLGKGSFLVIGGIHRSHKRIGLGLGSLHGGLRFLFSGLHRVAVLVGGGRGLAAEIDIAVVVGVQRGGILLIVGLNVLVGNAQAVGVGALVTVHQSFPLHTGLEGGGGHILAVHGLQIAVIGIAVGLGSLFGGGDGLIHIGLVIVGQGVAGLRGGGLQGRDLLQLLNGTVQELVKVALGLFLVRILGSEILAGIKSAAAGAVCLIHIIGEIIVDIGDGVIAAAHRQSGLAALEDAGVPDQQGGHQHGNNDADDRIDNGLALGGLLLLELLPLLLSQALCRVALARFLFSGCAHL